METEQPHVQEDVKADEEWEPAPSSTIPSETCEGPSALDELIVERLGAALEAVASRNPDQDDALFAGKCTPQISLTDYLKRILRYVDRTGSSSWTNLSVGVRGLMCAVLYLDRLSSKSKPTHVNRRTVHRWIATAMLVALKMNEDARVELRYYSALVGISVPDLIRFESAFLRRVEWDVVVDRAEFDARVARFSALLSRRPR